MGDISAMEVDTKIAPEVLEEKKETNEKLSEFDIVNKGSSDNVFKKPAFIGPKKGPKKKPNDSSDKINSNSDNVDKCDDPNEIEQESSFNKPQHTKKNIPPLPYSEPIWKGTTSENYTLEELKSGVIESVTNLQKKSFIVFGRIDACDVVMAHPTISRYHAVLQYRGVPDGEEEKGFYLYDLDSTHGTFLNKARLKPNVYARVRVGHMIKLGCSTRFFLLQGPEYDQEEESDLTFTEMKEKRKQELLEKKRKEEEELRLKEEEEERQQKLIEERGISWGLGEDADEEEDLSENPYAVTTNEELYIDDPKKALRQWFEREGEEMHLETEQVEKGMMACKIVLPLDDERGHEITVESSARTKKEAQTQCCLEACRIIDRMGLFRQAKQEAKKRQTRNWEENDYYDSDEDSFLDRTGDLDIKRQKRMKKVGKIQETVETYESLMAKHSLVLKELECAEEKLQKLLMADRATQEAENEDIDALDSFMKNLKQDKPGKLDIKIAKDEVAKLKKEEDHLRKLVNIVKPTSMPELKPAYKPLKRNIEPKNMEIVRSDTKSNSMISGEKNENNSNDEPIKKKVVGPALPNPLLSQKERSTIDQTKTEENTTEQKRKNKTKSKQKQVEENSLKDEDDIVNLVWRPPKGQTGDGRTSLNDKLGY